jgi:hypothetical protein
VKPEPLRVTLAALDGHPRDSLVDLRGSRPQQNGLPASRGWADERDSTRSGGRQPLEENGSRNEPIRRRSRLLLGLGQIPNRDSPTITQSL